MTPFIVKKLSRFVTNVTLKMARNPETTLVCLSLAFQLLMTRLSVTWSSGHANNDTPTAVPPGMFPPDSPVHDFPNGNLQVAQDQFRTLDADVSVAMYYAHWDGTSQQVAKDFDGMARQMVGQVTFVAVNCWYPYGTCRHQIQPPYYPVLIAHHAQQEGIQYKGIMTSAEISRFLRKVAAPFLYVSSKEMLDRLQALEDTLVIAHFNFTKYQESEPPGFESFHRAALLSLEKDPIQHVQFGIITNPSLAKTINLHNATTIVLLRTLKEPLYYPGKRKFKAKPIMNWVFENREQLFQWVVPVGVKSLIMSKQLLRKPALILFTNHLHSKRFLNDVHLLRMVAMDYNNCNSSTLIYHRIQQIEQLRRQIADDITRTQKGECCQTLAMTTKLPHIPNVPTGRQNVCEVCEQFTQPTMRDPFNTCSSSSQNCRSSVLNSVKHNFVTSPDSCLYVDNYYSPFSHFEICCQSKHLCSSHNCVCNKKGLLHQKQLINMNTFSKDSSKFCTDCQSDCSSKNINQCSDKSIYNIHHSYKNCTHDETFTALGCKTNKSVNFFAMRMDLYKDFAERIGLHSSVLDGEEQESALALIDIKNEIQHVLPLDNGLTTADLQDLLINFTRANLSRHLRSTELSSASLSSLQDGSKLMVDDYNDTGFTVTEVVSATFEAVVLHSKKNVLLFYYAPWCGFCSQLHHIYLLLARFLQDTPNIIIARINGDLNDLPWEFSAPEYPTLLLFPARRKDNSIRYPENMPYNLPNILRFVLENIQ